MWTDSPLGKNIELLAVSLSPYYLRREFPQLFSFWFTFIPELAATATEHIMNSLNNLEHISPDASKFILGDFDH